MKDWLAKCKEVVNSRVAADAFRHGESEMDELSDEIYGDETGEDGVVGEAVDVILCMLDIISLDDPEMTMAGVEEIMERKFQKWKAKYSDIIEA